MRRYLISYVLQKFPLHDNWRFASVFRRDRRTMVMRAKRMPKGMGNAVKISALIYGAPGRWKLKKKKEKLTRLSLRNNSETGNWVYTSTSKAPLRQHESIARARRITTSWVVILLCTTKFRIKASAAHECPCQQRNSVRIFGMEFLHNSPFLLCWNSSSK